MMGRRSVPSLASIIACHFWYVLAIASTAAFFSSSTCTVACCRGGWRRDWALCFFLVLLLAGVSETDSLPASLVQVAVVSQ